METITLNIRRSDVYTEVDKTTDYTGAKLNANDNGARDRIAATEDDLKTLSRFWEETCSAANGSLKEMLVGSSLPSDEDYSVTLQVSVAFDKELTPSVEASLRSFFIVSITGKWYVFANKGEAKDYFAEAGELIEDVRRKLYSRKRPVSPRRK